MMENIEDPLGRQTATMKPVYVTVAALLSFALVGFIGHRQFAIDPAHVTGISLILHHLFTVIVAVSVFLLSFTVGNKLLAVAGFSWKFFAEEAVFSVGVGAGALSCAILLLALAGLLNPFAIGTLVVVCAVLTGRQLNTVIAACQAAAKRDYSKPSEIGYILAFALLILIMLVRALTPPHAYDEAIYHLAAAQRFVEAGKLIPLYDIAQGNTHFLTQMLYVVCLMLKVDSAAKLLSVGFALMTAAALYAFSRRFFDAAMGRFAALAFFGAGMVLEVAVTARIDVTLAGFLFLATYSMMVYLDDRSPRWLWLSAYLSGISIAVKLTGLVWVAMLGLIFLVKTLWRTNWSDRVRHIKLGLLYCLILMAVVSPWLAKNYAYFGNPLYPLVSGESLTDRSNESVRYFGTTEDGQLEQAFQKVHSDVPQLVENTGRLLSKSAARRQDRNPFMFWEYFTRPDVYNVGEVYHNPNYLFIICPLFLVFGLNRKLLWLGVSSVLFFFVMAGSAWTARYLLPVYPALTVIAAYVVIEGTRKLKSRAALTAYLPAIALVLTTGATMFIGVSQLIKTRGLSYVNGSMSGADFMNQFFYYPSIRHINENLGPDVKVFMMGAQMGYDLKRSYVADTGWDSTPWRRLLIAGGTPDGVHQKMKEQGITHVLYSPDLYMFSAMIGREGIAGTGPQSGARPDYYPQWRNWVTFENFKSRYLKPVYSDEYGYTLFEVH